MRFFAIREWLKTEWLAWTASWQALREERLELTRRSGTITVPLEEHCVLLEAANRELKALELLGEAQETIRKLRGVVAAQQQILDKEEVEGLKVNQVLIDREWLKTEWLAWTASWQALREERLELTRRSGTITVPLEEHCVLLEAANRELKALELLGEAQETIRKLRGVVAAQQQILDKEEVEGLKVNQVLIDRMV